MRYIKRAFSNDSTTATSECISFLEGTYQSVAETLPDIKDNSISKTLVDSSELLLLDDSYTAPVALKKVIKTKFVKRKGPRRFKSGLVKQDRAETKELRYLPPGRMKDYYNNMMLAQHPEGLCELLSGTWMIGLSGCFSCFPLNLIEV
jgi:hypothetical protein